MEEELRGLIEAWRDDAANYREGYPPDKELDAMADVYDECADEIEAFLKRRAEANQTA